MEQRLREIKSTFKESTSPSSDEEIKMLLHYLTSVGVTNPGIPEELISIWKIAGEWHLIEDSYDVFGFNMFGPERVVELTKSVFGDDNIRREWEEELGPQSCAHIDWICFASYSEFDYIFVNLNKDSPLFGATKHMVNNCNQENVLTHPPFSHFIDYLEVFIENRSDEEGE